MSYRNAGVVGAVCSLLATAGFAFGADAAAEVAAPKMSIAPTVVTLDDAAPDAPLMMGLGKIGVADPLKKAGINIYGYVEVGYTYNNRNNQFAGSGLATRVMPGAFNYQHKNNVMVNQIDLTIERTVDSSKGAFDIGGRLNTIWGTDADAIHSDGFQLYGPKAAAPNYDPSEQFDFAEAYVDVAVPVKGLSFRAGKFATLIGSESLNPTANPFYSRSWIYASEPVTNTGVLAMYTLNDQWSFTAGVDRGWDQTLKDDNGAPAVIGQAVYAMNKQWNFTLNTHVGPEDFHDTAHYRTLINPIASFQATDKLKLSAEGLYVYDGGMNSGPGASSFSTPGWTSTTGGGYGDYYGGALYAGYALNDMFTLNARGEVVHYYIFPTPGNVYELTLGVTITPMPKDPLFKNIMIRPEVRYDVSDKNIFATGTDNYRNQLTFAGDLIVKF